MDYDDMLNSPEWKKKRLKILERDNFECQRCGLNSKSKLKTFAFKFTYSDIKKHGKIKFFIDDDFNVGLVKIKLDKLKVICKTSLTKEDLAKKGKYLIIGNYVNKDKIKYPFNGSTKKILVDNLFIQGANNKTIKNLNVKLKKNRIVDKEGFYLIKKSQDKEYAKQKRPLHVHHKCYRKDKKMWNQKNKEYVTLCNVCHLIVHDSQKIPTYD